MNKKYIFSELNKIETVYAHFDRIRIWADTDISFFDCARLTNFEAEGNEATIIYRPEGMEYNSAYKYYIDLFQPSKQNISYLITSLMSVQANFIVNNIEVTYDIISNDPYRIASIVNQYLVHPRKNETYFKQIADDDSNMHYWGVRGLHDHFPASYIRESKIAHKPCFHLEWKLNTKQYCATNKILTPYDITDYDFKSFFENNATFYIQPKKHQIGRALAQLDHNEKRCDRWYELYCDNNIRNIKGLGDFKDIKKVPVQKLLTKISGLNSVLKLKKHNKYNIDFTKSVHKALLKNCKAYC